MASLSFGVFYINAEISKSLAAVIHDASEIQFAPKLLRLRCKSSVVRIFTSAPQDTSRVHLHNIRSIREFAFTALWGMFIFREILQHKVTKFKF